ncbi:MAG TPA: FHA domain-containing protein [Planctomycetota bacterium]|nr:FHA domain-containing protein [Planctomycetota bacterium]HQB00112.1 FHA domain-containing protein [Planctomycetota bacterium]
MDSNKIRKYNCQLECQNKIEENLSDETYGEDIVYGELIESEIEEIEEYNFLDDKKLASTEENSTNTDNVSTFQDETMNAIRVSTQEMDSADFNLNIPSYEDLLKNDDFMINDDLITKKFNQENTMVPNTTAKQPTQVNTMAQDTTPKKPVQANTMAQDTTPKKPVQANTMAQDTTPKKSVQANNVAQDTTPNQYEQINTVIPETTAKSPFQEIIDYYNNEEAITSGRVLTPEEEEEYEKLLELKQQIGETMPFQIKVVLSGQIIDTLVFDKNLVTIGRDAECDIVINNLGTSRVHAEIERIGKLFFLRDKQSKTGTFIKGQRIYEHVLNSGDEIFLAKHTLYFQKMSSKLSKLATKSEKKNIKNKKATKSFKAMATTMAIDVSGLAQQRDVAPAYLMVVGTMKKIPITKRGVFFGKSSNNEIVTGGFLVSARHAVIIHEKKGFYLYHIGAFRPPKVNGKAVYMSPLKNGDRLDIGTFQCIFMTTYSPDNDE